MEKSFSQASQNKKAKKPTRSVKSPHRDQNLSHSESSETFKQTSSSTSQEHQDPYPTAESKSNVAKQDTPKHYLQKPSPKPLPSEASGYRSKIKQKLERKDKDKKTNNGFSTSDMSQFLHSNTLGKN